jgi:hypothetical protein
MKVDYVEHTLRSSNKKLSLALDIHQLKLDHLTFLWREAFCESKVEKVVSNKSLDLCTKARWEILR